MAALTGFPEIAFSQDFACGLNGSEPAIAHCGKRLGDPPTGRVDLGKRLSNAALERSLSHSRNIPSGVYGTFRETLSFELRRNAKKKLVLGGASGQITEQELGWLQSLASPSAIHLEDGRQTVDPSARQNLEVTWKTLRCKIGPSAELLRRVRDACFPTHRRLKCRFEKLLIYGKDSFVETHRDAALGVNHVGTLLVIVKGDYRGGQLHFSWGTVGSGDRSWFVAFHPDLPHSVSKIIEGQRVVFKFSLFGVDPISRKAMVSAKMRSLRDDLRSMGDVPAGIVVRTERQYTLEQLEARAWSWSDGALENALRDASFANPKAIALHHGTYDYRHADFYWISRYSHHDAACGCDLHSPELVPAPNIIRRSQVLMLGFDSEMMPEEHVGATKFYDLGTQLTTYRVCGFAVSGAQLIGAKWLRLFLLASYKGDSRSVLPRLMREQRDVWVKIRDWLVMPAASG
jgi:hypothetical protein